MPIYEYLCAQCGHHLEKLQRLSDAPLTHCPACETNNLSKQISAAGFQLKGDGWYVTDFKNKDKKPKDETGKTETKAAPEKKETKDTTVKKDKPATKDKAS
jgi:putative FmdB family regulatory protein